MAKIGEQQTGMNVDIDNLNPQDQELLEGFLAYIEKNYSNSDLKFEPFYKKLYISRATFFRKIEKLTGESPQAFLQSFRLKKAAQLLRDDYGNVSEVSYEVGFSDPFYFSKCFKKAFDQSPKIYQLEQLKIKREADRKGKTLPSANLLNFSIETLDQEIRARNATALDSRQADLLKQMISQPHRNTMKKIIENQFLNMVFNEALNHFSPNELTLELLDMIDKKTTDLKRNGLYVQDRLDIFRITDSQVRENTRMVAAVCTTEDMTPADSDHFKLNALEYGPTYYLLENELFFNQPISAGSMCSGVLVEKDVIATTAHFIKEKNITDIRFVFDFIMIANDLPATQIPHDKVYKGVEVIKDGGDGENDWVLIKLDRSVTDREAAELSQNKSLQNQSIYSIGHPMGLPLKYAPGAAVIRVMGQNFSAGLDVYGNGSGSPVFCTETHKLMGIVAKRKLTDFRWLDEGFITLRYPKSGPDYEGTPCIGASSFGHYIKSR